MKYPIRNEAAFIIATALYLMEHGEKLGAAALLLKITDKYPNDFRVNFTAGLACDKAAGKVGAGYVWSSEADRYRQLSAKYYAAASQMRVGDFYSAYNAATMYQRIGNNDEAVVYAERAVSMRPTFAPAWMRLGQILRDKKRISGAVVCFENTVILYPEHNAAQQELAALGIPMPRPDTPLNGNILKMALYSRRCNP